MPSPSKPIIVVCGATGTQGGSVINSLLQQSDKYHLRAITRNPDSKNAKELEKKGVELIQGDLNKEDDLTRAFSNAYGVFAVTNYYDHSLKNHVQEEEQGKLIADVAKKMGVQHFIFSALEDAKEVSKGKYSKVYHFNGKAHVLEHIKKIGLPYTGVRIAYYYENNLGSLGPQKQEDGSYVFKSMFRPTTKVPMVSASMDIGPVVVQILANREQYLGKTLDVTSEAYTIPEVTEIMAKVAGHPIKYQYVSPQELPKEIPFLASNEDLREMFEYINDFGLFSGANIKESRIVGIKYLTFEEFLRKINWKLPQ
ncbi:uncharacterized protein VTP21DRAFT_6182 [Calcarisporiella thermophila]|uniref:uncharacterized protein n=1 Tax=Calcarisporiella thermophila TaxID=911321 RepID=UPI0037447C4F